MTENSDLNLLVRSFDQLSIEDLYAICVLRQEVFVVEQECPYLDADGLDKEAVHLFRKENNKIVSYSRVLPPKKFYSEHSAIGRVVVKMDFRKEGYGRKIMEESIHFCFMNYPDFPIKISAQNYLISFYESLGFEINGESYLEDGIPHTAMIKKKH